MRGLSVTIGRLHLTIVKNNHRVRHVDKLSVPQSVHHVLTVNRRRHFQHWGTVMVTKHASVKVNPPLFVHVINGNMRSLVLSTLRPSVHRVFRLAI